MFINPVFVVYLISPPVTIIAASTPAAGKISGPFPVRKF